MERGAVGTNNEQEGHSVSVDIIDGFLPSRCVNDIEDAYAKVLAGEGFIPACQG